MKMVKKDNIIKGFQEVITDITKNGDDCAILYLDRETNNTYHFGSQCGLNFLAKNSDISQRFLCSCYGMLMVAIGQPGNIPSQPSNIPSQPLPPVSGVFRVSNTEPVENQQVQNQQVLPSQHLVTDHDQMDQNADVDMQQSETPLEADPQTDDTSEKVPQTEQSPISEPQTEQVQQPEQLLQEGIKTELVEQSDEVLQEGIKTEPVEQYEEAMQEEFQSEHAQQLEETPQEGQQNEQRQQIKVNRDSSGRFHHVTLEEISHYHDSNDQSRSTKFNTRWSTKIIQAMFESDLESDDQVDGTAEQPAPVPGYQEAEAGGSTSHTRFQKVTDDQMKEYEEAHHSEKTRLNTKWVVRLFQDWSIEMSGQKIDFETVTTQDLIDILTKFYCSAKPQKSEKGNEEYQINTLKNIRAGINRHLQNIGRNINIVNDAEFKGVNRVFSGILKERVKSGASRLTKHKEIISFDDMNALRLYFLTATDNPVVLRHYVWFSIAFHFVTRGNETHFQLTPTSFSFQSDDQGEFAMLTHETVQKNHQGVAEEETVNSGKVMYATRGPLCPLGMLRLFLQKTDPEAQKLFNQCNTDAFMYPVSTTYWFTSKALSHRTLLNFMPDIGKSACASMRYTNNCVRATAIQYLNDADVEERHIKFLSDHTNESSIRSYNRVLRQEQKRRLSAILSSALGEEISKTPP